MRLLAIVLVLASGVAHAESGEAMRARGEQLAKEGRYSEAIDSFKAAERLEPRARHSCLIALAYIRRELWPQAEIFLADCEKRATAADPQPEWVPAAKEQLAQRLTTVNVAPVAIEVQPIGLDVKLAVSSFAPDELFAPRTIHLQTGRHTLTATAPGYADETTTVTVSDRAPVTVTITMKQIGTGLGDPAGEPTLPRGPQTVTTSAPSKLPYYLMGGGAVLGVAGAIVHLTLFRSAKSDLQDAVDANDVDAYNERSGDYDTWRNVAIGLYAVGGAAVLTGAILKYTVYKGEEPPAQVSITPTGHGGGMVSIGWSR